MVKSTAAYHPVSTMCSALCHVRGVGAVGGVTAVNEIIKDVPLDLKPRELSCSCLNLLTAAGYGFSGNH